MTKQQPPSQTPPPYPGYPPPYVVYPPEEPINWGEYWRLIVKNRKLIGIITAASTLWKAFKVWDKEARQVTQNERTGSVGHSSTGIRRIAALRIAAPVEWCDKQASAM